MEAAGHLPQVCVWKPSPVNPAHRQVAPAPAQTLALSVKQLRREMSGGSPAFHKMWPSSQTCWPTFSRQVTFPALGAQGCVISPVTLHVFLPFHDFILLRGKQKPRQRGRCRRMIDEMHKASIFIQCSHSSVGQSVRLITERSTVRARVGAYVGPPA